MTTITAARSSQSRVFVAEGLPGPDNPPVFQGCLVMGGASQSLGDTEYIYCPDPETYDGFVVVGEIIGREEGVETGLSGHFPLSALSNIVKWGKSKTALAIHCHFGIATNPQTFNVFEKAVIFDERARITSTDVEDMGSLEEATRIGQSASISAASYYEVVALNYISRVENLIDNEGRGCAIQKLYDESLPLDNRFAYYITAGTDTPGTNEFIYSVDGGSTWDSIDLSTAIASQIVGGVAVVNEVPVIVSAGTTDTYYVDVINGSTTVVTVTGTNAINCIAGIGNAAYVGGDSNYFGIIEDYAAAPVPITLGSAGNIISVHALAGGVVLAGDDAGVVFYSTDGVNFGTYDLGADGVTAVCAVSDTVFWAGTDGGDLFYSTDAGQTWKSRGFSGSGSGVVTSIIFPTLSVGWISHDPGTATQAVLLKTTGAGATGTWSKVPVSGALPASDSLIMSSVPGEPNLILATGPVDETADGDGVIVLGLPS